MVVDGPFDQSPSFYGSDSDSDQDGGKKEKKKKLEEDGQIKRKTKNVKLKT